MNEIITIDKRLVCKYVDIPKPRRRSVLDMALVWLESRDTSRARLAAIAINTLAALYLLGQIIRYLAG